MATVINHLDERDVERIVDERLALRLKSVGAQTPWMTERELAEYLRLYDRDGNPQVASIKAWTTRAEHPLPCGLAGERSRRYHREQVDVWLREEAERVRAAKMKQGDEDAARGPRRVNERR